ncbi:beta-1,3-glucanase family protein [Lentisphaerota bacterium ZTH]|nr:hypothetical protein JYG24_05775 [Lentisphaerota bacterium]WET06987.1 beta-1,3-glucanase family protein [Lentisphaerota bacterium ZTH]
MSTIKKMFLPVIIFAALFWGLSSNGKGVLITINNTTKDPVYVYNFQYSPPGGSVKAMTIDANKISALTICGSNMRIYISHQKLKNSLEKGIAPDPFNPQLDGNIMYSFVEYTTSNSGYTVDISYIDAFSFPLTLKFYSVCSYLGCQEGFEYGFKKLSSVKTALTNQKDYSWNALIWPSPWNKAKFYRIVGPNKAWTLGLKPGKTPPPNVPSTYQNFIDSLPSNGDQLFGSQYTNWNGWQNLPITPKSSPSPSTTGYVKALHYAAKPDNNSKYGFFCYPKDNTSGQFTNVPTYVSCTITVYPYDK